MHSVYVQVGVCVLGRVQSQTLLTGSDPGIFHAAPVRYALQGFILCHALRRCHNYSDISVELCSINLFIANARELLQLPGVFRNHFCI